MSGIGFTNLGALNLAGTFSGTQRAGSEAEPVRQPVRVDQPPRDALSLEDDELASDRDGSGQSLNEEPTEEESLDEPSVDASPQSRRAADADGERGVQLDLDA